LPQKRAGKKKEKRKRTLVLTLGSPSKKGRKKKPVVLTLGSPSEKGERKKKKKKNPVRLSVEVLKPDGQDLEFQDLDGLAKK
jgi:hypothetical protein